MCPPPPPGLGGHRLHRLGRPWQLLPRDKAADLHWLWPLHGWPGVSAPWGRYRTAVRAAPNSRRKLRPNAGHRPTCPPAGKLGFGSPWLRRSAANEPLRHVPRANGGPAAGLSRGRFDIHIQIRSTTPWWQGALPDHAGRAAAIPSESRGGSSYGATQGAIPAPKDS